MLELRGKKKDRELRQKEKLGDAGRKERKDAGRKKEKEMNVNK